MNNQKENDKEKYRRLLQLHLNDPINGISEEDLNWMMEYEENNLHDPEVIKTKKEIKQFDDLILKTSYQEGDKELGLGTGIPSEDERIEEQLDRLTPRLDSEFGIKLQPGQKAKERQADDVKSSITAIAFLAFIFNAYRKRPIRSIIISLFLIISIGFLVKSIFISYPTGSPMAYTENSHLEKLVSVVSRSDYSIKVESPQKGMNFKIRDIADEVEILFEGDIEGQQLSQDNTLHLKIFTNSKLDYISDSAIVEKTIQFVTEKDQYRFQETVTAKLSPGLYYFTLDIKDEQLFVGKFFINKK